MVQPEAYSCVFLCPAPKKLIGKNPTLMTHLDLFLVYRAKRTQKNIQSFSLVAFYFPPFSFPPGAFIPGVLRILPK